MLATLFWSGLVLSAVAAIGLTELFISPRDAIAPLLPAEIDAYVHVDAATAAASGYFAVPEEIRPSEIAYADMASKTSDGKAAQVRLYAWPWYRNPKARELAWLNAHAQKIGRRVYAEGWNDLPAAGAMDAEILRSLRFAADLGPVSGFIDQRWLTATVHGTLPSVFAEALSQFGPFVFAARENSSMIGLTLLPLSMARNVPTLLGYAIKPAPATRFHPLVDEASSITVVADDGSSVDPSVLLTTESSQILMALGTSMTRAARQNLLEHLQGPVSYNISPKKDGVTPRFIAHFPKISPNDLTRTLKNYSAALSPEKRSLQLPDRDSATEFVLNFALVPAEHNGFSALIIPAPGNGSYLTNIPTPPQTSPSRQTGCKNLPVTASLTIRDTALLEPTLAGILMEIGLKQLYFGLAVDKSIIFCGYKS